MLIALILYRLTMNLLSISLFSIKEDENVFLISIILALLFLAILFLQSGIDKIIDKKGNLDWLTSHFSKSPFKSIVPLLLFVITIVEVLSGVCNLIGITLIIINDDSAFAILGTLLAAISLVMLFLGQRLAKDYAGAQSLVSYFILTILTLVFLAYYF